MLTAKIFKLMLMAGVVFMMAMDSPRVFKGGTSSGQSTVTVDTGHGVSVTWSTRTGAIQTALIGHSQGHSSLDMNLPSPSWFIRSNGRLIPMAYRWRGYRIQGDQVTLLHELTMPDGPTWQVEEQPASIVGRGGLLALQRTFKVSSPNQGTASRGRLVKRIRTGTNQGVTLPNQTNGPLYPLGLNDNFMADVVFVQSGPTIITTSFNGHWVDQPERPVTVKESRS